MVKYLINPAFLENDTPINKTLIGLLLMKCKQYDFYYKQLYVMFRHVKPNTYNVKWIGHHKDGIIGFNIFEYHGNVIGDEEHIISSQFLFVDPKHRNKGIATELLNLPDICDNPTYRVECKKTELQFFDKQGYKFKRLSKTGEYLVLEK